MPVAAPELGKEKVGAEAVELVPKGDGVAAVPKAVVGAAAVVPKLPNGAAVEVAAGAGAVAVLPNGCEENGDENVDGCCVAPKGDVALVGCVAPKPVNAVVPPGVPNVLGDAGVVLNEKLGVGAVAVEGVPNEVDCVPNEGEALIKIRLDTTTTKQRQYRPSLIAHHHSSHHSSIVTNTNYLLLL